MASLGISVRGKSSRDQLANTQAAVGPRSGAAPFGPRVNFQLNISTKGRLTTIEEFNNIIGRATAIAGLLNQGHRTAPPPRRARLEIGPIPALATNGRPGEAIAIYHSPGPRVAVAAGIKNLD